MYTSSVLSGLPFCIVIDTRTTAKPLPGTHINSAQLRNDDIHKRHIPCSHLCRNYRHPEAYGDS